MTNEELDRARVDEAIRTGNGIVGTVALIAARLAREGWTPPVAVDPDLAEADRLHKYWEDDAIDEVVDVALAGIKRGRELERAEAKPGMVWEINRGLSTPSGAPILTRDEDGNFYIMRGCTFSGLGEEITHYAIITQPEEK